MLAFIGYRVSLHGSDVKKGCEIFLSQHGLSLAKEKITISTAGYLPGLERWKDEMPDVNIALRFILPYEEKRNKLIPINKRYSLFADVLKFVDAIPHGKNVFVRHMNIF